MEGFGSVYWYQIDLYRWAKGYQNYMNICEYFAVLITARWSASDLGSHLQPLCQALRRSAWFMSRVGAAEMSTGASCSCITSESLRVVLGTDCLFVTRTRRLPSWGEEESDAVSAVSVSFARFLTFSVWSSVTVCERRRASKCWRGWKPGREFESRCTVKKKKKEKCCFEQSLLVWQIKKHTCEKSASAWFLLNQSGLHRCPCQPPRRLRCQLLTYSCHSHISHPLHCRRQIPLWMNPNHRQLRRTALPVHQ